MPPDVPQPRYLAQEGRDKDGEEDRKKREEGNNDLWEWRGKIRGRRWAGGWERALVFPPETKGSPLV
jgi:hypothetical protein